MFKVRVIPCLDVKDGRVVKGVNFVDLRDAGDPVEAAIAYDAAGADELCFLDITATPRKSRHHARRGAAYGGGLLHAADGRRRRAHHRRHPHAVAVAAPTRSRSIRAAVSRREFVKEAAEKFGDQCIVVAIDAKRVAARRGSERWEIFTHGGRKSTGHRCGRICAQEVVSLGAGEILLTSMDRDGTRQGFDIRADPRGRRSVRGAGDCLRWRRQPRSSGRRYSRRPCHRGAGGLDLPFRGIHHPPGQGPYGPRRACRCGSIPDNSGRRSARICSIAPGCGQRGCE